MHIALIFLRCLRSRWFVICSTNALTEAGRRAVIRMSSICDGRDGVLGPCTCVETRRLNIK